MQSLTPDTYLGRFRLLTPLGRGGMGEVWKAEDQRLGRIVAIKVLPPELANPELKVRFERESKILAALNHPGIAHIYEAGEEIPAGRSERISFLVMEYIEGRSLAQILSSGPMPVRTAVRLGRQMAKALGAAHEAGIIHRDLKPANIMVTSRNLIKILDFGLARPIGAVFKSGTQTLPEVTTSGMVLGTAAYLSPEQVKGDQADERSDIWAAGCVLYQMLTGSRPFSSDSIPEILAAVLRDDPKSLADLNPDIPTELVSIIEKCLNKNSALRPQSAKEIGNVLKDVYLQMRRGGAGTESMPGEPAEISYASSMADTVNRYIKLTNPAFPNLVSGKGADFAELDYRGARIGLILTSSNGSQSAVLVFVAPVIKVQKANAALCKRLLSLSNGLSGIGHFAIDSESEFINLVCTRPLLSMDPRLFQQTLDCIAEGIHKYREMER